MISLLIVSVVAGSGCSSQSGDQIEHRNVAFDISPDGKQIVFASADGDLYLLHLEDSRVVRLTTTARNETTPAFSPDGKSIVFAGSVYENKGSSIFVCTVDGQNAVRLTNDAAMADSMPSYSKDGSQIVFARAHLHRPYSMGGWTWDDWDLSVIKSDGADIRRVTKSKYYDISSPKFLADGKTIVYSTDENRNRHRHTVFEVDVGGKQAPQILTDDRPAGAKGGAWATQPSVSSDGASIAVISDRKVSYAYDVVIMDRDGSKPTSLGITNMATYNYSPKFLPDGKTLLFLAGTETNAGSRAIYSLWQVDANGKNPRRIADSGLFTDPLNWQPKK